MNDSRDPFDWSSLGEAPLPDEMDDDTLLSAVLMHAQAEAAAAPDPAPGREQQRAPRPAGWIRPVVAAVVLLAAAAVLLVYAPKWTEVWMGTDADGSLAPDLEAETGGETARVHVQTDSPKKKAAPVHEEPRDAVIVAPQEAVPAADADPSSDAAVDAAPTRPKVQRHEPAPSADALLREAQDAMAAKDSAGAIRKYGALLRKHPQSPEARAARVTLGRLELNAGNAKLALAHYDTYLSGSGGPMRREAELGRIDALRKLGRAEDERRAIEAFLGDHPSTVHATRLRARLEALR